jgi:plastocyanin
VTSIDVPQTGSGGSVVIAESAIDETAPSGFQFLAQQVNISSDVPTTASNPLRITFDVDISGLQPPPAPADVSIYRTEGAGSPTPIADCTSPGTTADPDPCVVSRSAGTATDIVLVVLTSSASHWNVAVQVGVPIQVTDSGFNPKAATVPLGSSAIWSFVGARSHSATDTAKLGPSSAPLFDSGSRLSGSYAFELWSAGSYAYRSTPRLDAKSFTGSLLVPLTVTPSAGTISTTFTIIWASRSVAGYANDVQYRFKAKGSKTFGKWIAWRSGATGVSATFNATRLGTYEFEGRLRNVASGHASGWSPATGMVVQ